MEQIRAHGWDLESVDYFDILYSNIPRWEGPDRMRWRLNGHGRFDVCYYYKTLRGPTDVSFPWKSLWCSKEPRRIAFFIRTTWGKISTCDNLIKRTHISKLVFHVEVWWWVIVALRMICGLMFFYRIWIPVGLARKCWWSFVWFGGVVLARMLLLFGI